MFMITHDIVERIEEAAKNKTVELDLSGYELTSLPPEIVKLANLTQLGLCNNQLTSLPPEILKLTNLTQLDL